MDFLWLLLIVLGIGTEGPDDGDTPVIGPVGG